jgi:membrane protease YdiL (CAAX protease family)
MSDAELPSPRAAAAVVLIATPFLVLAWRGARRMLPARPPSGHRWRTSEAVLVVLAPFGMFAFLAAFVPLAGILPALFANQLALAAGGVLAFACAARRPDGATLLGLAARPPPGALLAVPLVLVPLFFFSRGLLFWWLRVCRAQGWEESQEVLRLLLELEGGDLVLAAVIAIVVAPFVEELLFRGFLQSAFAQVVGEGGALFCTSAVFALLHGLAALPVLFSLSLFLGWLQQRTRSLLVPIGAHALNNAVSLALALALEGREL